MLNMVSTLDGRATLGGRSGAIGNRADRELFHALRAAVDAVMVGAGTVRVERYGRIVARRAAPGARALRARAARGAARVHRLGRACRSPHDTPLLAEPEARVVIVTASAASLPRAAAQVEYVRAARDGELDLARGAGRAARALRRAHAAVRGRPAPERALLLAAGLVDELFLSLSPQARRRRADATGEALRILAGAELDRARRARAARRRSRTSRTCSCATRVASRAARVSRETTPSSSLAS